MSTEAGYLCEVVVVVVGSIASKFRRDIIHIGNSRHLGRLGGSGSKIVCKVPWPTAAAAVAVALSVRLHFKSNTTTT